MGVSEASEFSPQPCSVDAYARHWIAFQSGSIDFDDEMDEPLDAILDGGLAFSDPQRALDVVVRILDFIRDDEGGGLGQYIGVLAAGLTEDIIGGHGEHVIERIEAIADTRADLAEVLGGVAMDTSDDVWRRIRAVAAPIEAQPDPGHRPALRSHRKRLRATRLHRRR